MKRKLLSLASRPWWQLLLGCLILSLCLELVVFNYKYWLQFVTSYERMVLLNSPEYSQEAALNTGPVVVDREHSAITIAVPDFKIRNIKLNTVHPNNPELVIRGTILSKTNENKYLYQRVANFILSTKHEVRSNIVLPKEKITRELRIEFEVPQGGSFYLNTIILNDDLAFAPNFGRVLLLFLPLAALALILRFRLYAQVYQPKASVSRRAGAVVLLFNVGLVASILVFNNPITGLNAKSQCIFPQQCTFDYGATPGSLLQKRPESYDERFNSNIYHQQFDAWLKGQTALDVAVDPRVNDMEDLYDQGEFYQAGVGWLFDHVIYQGKYYNYYGVAPLILVYAPVYALTGMFPTPILVTSVLALIGVLAAFWALNAWVRLWGMQPNLLLYLLAQLALPGMSMIFFGQAELHAAQETCSAGYAMALLLVASGCETILRRGKTRLALAVLMAAAVVLVVLSRPHILFVALLFFVPLVFAFIARTKEDFKAGLQSLDLKTLAVLGLLVGAGAVGVMYYNYVRFGAVADFGQYYMVTAAVNLPLYQPSYDLAAVLEALYHTLWPTVHLNETFPFLETTVASVDDRTYYPFPIDPVFGILAFSANYSLVLLFWRVPHGAVTSSLAAPATLWGRSWEPLRVTAAMIVVAFLAVAVFNTIWGCNLLPRYSLDAAWAAALVSLLLLLCHIKWDERTSSQILYLIVVFALLSSALVGYLLNFTTQTVFVTQPVWFVELYNTFRPFIVQG